LDAARLIPIFPFSANLAVTARVKWREQPMIHYVMTPPV
jgi:hypothetical protein